MNIFSALFGLVGKFIPDKTAQINEKTAQLQLINHSFPLALLLTFFVCVFIYNCFANTFGWPIFQTGLSTQEIVASLLTTAGLVVGHNYVAKK